MTLRHGFNQVDMQDMNRSLLLNLLRKEGMCARTELAKMTGLKQATVTNIVNDFIAWGIVEEIGFLSGNKGRRSIGISINNTDFGVIGIQLARKHYSVGVFSLSGENVESTRLNRETETSSRMIMDEIINLVEKLIQKYSDRKILAIGMSVPGPYSIKSDRIELMTGHEGWKDILIHKELENTFHIPVFMEQDANAGALAQYWYDQTGDQNDTFIYIADGEGVGAGILVKGEILRGTLGTAGEIGHMSINYKGPRCTCGNYGCLENYCSSIAFTKEANRILAPVVEYKFDDVKAMVREGNSIVTEVFASCCDCLAIGISNLINVINPAVIVIGDEMAHIAPEIMLERIRQKVEMNVLPVLYENLTIRMSSVKDSMLLGAAIVAIKDVFERPAVYFEN